MQAFVDGYAEFRQMAGSVSKHVALTGELSRLVKERELMKVSELEQELASGTSTMNHGTNLENLRSLIANRKIRFEEKLRLVMLYALRYAAEKNEIPSLKTALRENALYPEDEQKILAVDGILSYARPSPELYGGGYQFLKKLVPFALKGVQNVFTQHRPLLVSTLGQLIRGRLPPSAYPFIDAAPQVQARPVQHVIVFVIGGVTYEEQVAVYRLNGTELAQGVNVLLGGSCIHNTQTFLDDLLFTPQKPHATDQKPFVFEEKSEKEML